LREKNGVRKYIETGLTLDPSALDTDSTNFEYDPVDLTIEFYALDDIFDFEATDDDMVGDFEEADLGEFAAEEPEWFDEYDLEGDFELDCDIDDDPKMSDFGNPADSGEYLRMMTVRRRISYLSFLTFV